MDEWIAAALADRPQGAPQRGPVPIDWASVDPTCLPDGSPLRVALEDGRPDVAEYLMRFAGSRLYIPTETTVRRELFEAEARAAVERGAMSGRKAARVYGVDRGRITS